MNLSGFFKKIRGGTERYLVVEEKDNFFEKTIASVCLRDKEIRILRQSEIAKLRELKKNVLRGFDKIVFALDSASATTVQDSVRVKTASRLKPITETELEDIVFKALWEFLNKQRVWVSKKLNVSDAALVLNDVQVRGVRLDSHNLFNPIGFKGDELEFIFKGTFVTKQLYHEIREAAKTVPLSILEKGSVLLSFLNGEKATLAYVGEERTEIFFKEGSREAFAEEINWGSVKFKERVSEEFGLNYQASATLVEAYARGSVSRTVERHFRKIIAGCFGDFFGTAHLGGKHVVFYFESLALPRNVFGKEVKGDFCRLDEELARKDLRITRGGKGDFDLSRHQDTAALLVYSYADQRYDFLNSMLRRRAGWLVSNF